MNINCQYRHDMLTNDIKHYISETYIKRIYIFVNNFLHIYISNFFDLSKETFKYIKNSTTNISDGNIIIKNIFFLNQYFMLLVFDRN